MVDRFQCFPSCVHVEIGSPLTNISIKVWSLWEMIFVVKMLELDVLWYCNNINGVRNVLELKKNLISLGVLDSRSYKYTSQGGALKKVSKGSLMVMKDTKIDNLYKIEGSAKPTMLYDKTYVSSCLWHQQIGHVGKK